jgi:glutamyl/glutaminyl-tRNA synthetase
MKPENLAGIQGSRGIPVTAGLEKKLKLSLEAQIGGAVVLHCQGRIIFGPEVRALTEAAVRKNILKSPRLKELLPQLAGHLDEVEPFTAEKVEAALRAFADSTGEKAGLFINAGRTMLTGQDVGPSMFDVFEIMGRERSVMRLRSQRPWNEFDN